MNHNRDERRKTPGLLACLTGRDASGARPRLRIGAVEGRGIGPEVIGAALQVLVSVEQALDIRFEVERLDGQCCGQGAGPEDAAEFCAEVFQSGGAILHGPEGGRYVYDLRRRFDLFCKFVPVRPMRELVRAAKFAPGHLDGVDILIVRDNTGGVYQGEWGERFTNEGRVAEHKFRYSEAEVGRLLEAAARAAAGRCGRLHVIIKESGVPTVSALWRDIAASAARKHGIEAAFMNVDLAAYELIQNPARFDVIVTPNLFGDILADIAGVLLASRGVTFSGNFNSHGHGVYQTNHGCAEDLAGADTANPAGQILSLAMLLRESFGLEDAAALIERSLAEVWRRGWRTADLAEPGCTVVGTRAMAERAAQQILRSSETNEKHARCATAG